jgi:hypothetical protein
MRKNRPAPGRRDIPRLREATGQLFLLDFRNHLCYVCFGSVARRLLSGIVRQSLPAPHAFRQGPPEYPLWGVRKFLKVTK